MKIVTVNEASCTIYLFIHAPHFYQATSKVKFFSLEFFFIIKAAIVRDTIFIEYLQRDKHAYLTHIYIAVKYTNWLTKFIDNQS